ncbi:MAG: hypothetical protein QM751_13965 [Paludibacteraceae bacterium]
MKTSVRVDGNYFYYKGVDQTLVQNMVNSTITMTDGNPYKYIGYYVGGETSSNGNATKKFTSNITFNTHIPAVRMIISLRIEGCFYDYSQNLSEYANGSRSFVLDSKNEEFPLDKPNRYLCRKPVCRDVSFVLR